jgi:glycosyltransferase involved in cell wall biosynthesis
VLVGEGVDEHNRALMQQLRESGLGPRVHLLGRRNDVPHVMAALDVATSSSIGEGFPNVVGEAMSAGACCVVTEVGDCAWIVGDSGFVVPPRRPELIAERWRTLYEMSAERRRQLGEAARRRIIERFALPAVVRQGACGAQAQLGAPP